MCSQKFLWNEIFANFVGKVPSILVLLIDEHKNSILRKFHSTRSPDYTVRIYILLWYTHTYIPVQLFVTIA